MGNFTEKGKFRANPDANIENATRFVCEDTPGTVAKDEATVDTSGGTDWTGIEYAGKDGTAVVLTFDTPVPIASGADKLRDEIFKTINKHEVDGIVRVDVAGANWTLKHWGAGTLSKVYLDGTASNLARTAL